MLRKRRAERAECHPKSAKHCVNLLVAKSKWMECAGPHPPGGREVCETFRQHLGKRIDEKLVAGSDSPKAPATGSSFGFGMRPRTHTIA